MTQKINRRKYLLLILNILFYCLLDFKSLPLLLLLILFTFFCTNVKKYKKFFAILGVSVTALVWLFYKSYIMRLPLGLSFYSFKIISYILDCYKGKISFQNHFISYFIYVTYFPEIISGPISRGNTIVNQLEQSFTFQKEKWLKGMQLILSGLFLKYVIANRAMLYVDKVFGDFSSYTGLTLFIAAILYSIQIYGDFSGYSNLSIGVSNLLGFEIERNFNRPYFSKSIKEFWGRWHISLSSWLKDYIYIPLGGNRKGKLRKWFNSMVTFLVSGFWHGNGTGYLFWGCYHGVLSNFSTPKTKSKIKTLGLQLLTFIEITIGWIFFRTESFTKGILYLKQMVTTFRIEYSTVLSSILPFTGDNSSIALAIILFLLVLFEWIVEVKRKDDYSSQNYGLILFVYVFSIIVLGVFGVNKFIYMNY